jgi:hypothetical protein
MNHFMIYENDAAISPAAFGYGVMEEEAFRDKSALNAIKKFSFRHTVQDYPQGSGAEDDPKIWNIHYLKFPADQLGSIENMMKKGMYDGWYSLLWVNKNDPIFVFQGEAASKGNLYSVAAKHGVGKGQIDLSVLSKFH